MQSYDEQDQMKKLPPHYVACNLQNRWAIPQTAQIPYPTYSKEVLVGWLYCREIGFPARYGVRRIQLLHQCPSCGVLTPPYFESHCCLPPTQSSVEMNRWFRETGETPEHVLLFHPAPL